MVSECTCIEIGVNLDPTDKKMADEEEIEISVEQKVEIAKWFLLNSPPGEIQYVAKGFLFILINVYDVVVLCVCSLLS